VEVEGLVKKPGKYALEDLIKLSAQEERIYRLRCVEGWSMVIPWVGYSMAELIRKVEPLGSAKYVSSSRWPTRKPCRLSARASWNGPTWKACAWTRPCIR
jgi:DMSO/TMAO reductase YedYZ molybdopterin-dependent catalytic subunit